MIKGTRISKPSQRNIHLQGFLPFGQTWLVSDLRSKLNLQTELLKLHPGLEDLSVLRAQDFWQLLLKQQDFSKVVLSRIETRSFLKQFVENLGDDIKNVPLNFIEKAIEEISPLYFQCEVADLADFISSKYEAKPYWYPWVLRIFKILDQFENAGMISQLWLTSYLHRMIQQGVQLTERWNREIIVDLGVHISFSESELLKHVAKDVQLQVLQPEFLFNRERFSAVLAPYEDLCPKPAPLQQETSLTSPTEIIEALSPFAEVQQAVQMIQDHLKKGVSLENIVVVAPQIEAYWPMLGKILKEEKIPASKSWKSRLSSYSLGQTLNSEAQVMLEEWSYSSLEALEFSRLDLENQQIKFAKFKAQLSHLLDQTDLQRLQVAAEKYKSDFKFNRGQKISGESFLVNVMSRVDEKWPMAFLEFFKNWLQETDRLQEQTLLFWKTLWTAKIYQTEVEVEPAQAQGLSLLNLAELDSEKYKVRIFLGLTQSHFARAKGQFLTRKESSELHQDLGVLIPSSEDFPLEYDLSWCLQTPTDLNYLFFPQTSSTGTLETPVQAWQELKVSGQPLFDTTKLAPLRLDTVRRHLTSDFFAALREKKFLSFDEIVTSQQLENKVSDWQTVSRSLKKLSVSDLENFKVCAFKAQASLLFPRISEPAVDTTSSAQDSGTIKHLLASRLSQFMQKTSKPTKDDLENLLKSTLQEVKFQFYDSGSRQIQTSQYLLWLVNLAKAFANWPKWNFLGEQIVSEKELSFIIQGVNIIARADRMDLSSDGEVFFTDYKSSTASILKPKSWLQEAHFQILAYIHLSEHLGLKPIGGAYYNLNQFQFGPGYLIEESAQAEVAKDFGLNAISSEVQSQMLADLHDQVLQAIDEISRGSLQALPLHEKHCRNCDWYSVCRSPFRETRREA